MKQEEAPYGAPVTTLDDLNSLDSDEMVEGYLDGFNGDPEPKGNRSRSYWHGWRNGASDKGYREIDAAQRALVKKMVSDHHPASAPEAKED
jgi:hypothetical protein